MAGQQEARLNLVLSAKDDASKIVEQVARNILSNFESVSTGLKEAFNSVRQSVDAAANNIASSFDRAKIHMEETATAASSIKKSLDFASLQLAGQMLEHVGQIGVGFFLSAVKSAADFDQEIQNTLASMKSLDPTLKTNAKLFNDLKKEAIDLGMKGFFSANQIAEAMNTLARQGVQGEENIKAAVKTVHDAAAANFEDLEHTANVVTDIYHEFGDQLKEQFGKNVSAAFQYIGDNMTSALHRARLSMDDYLNTLKYVGPLASHAGWTLRDMSQAIALLAEHGIKGSQAGTTLRRMLTNLTPSTKAATAEMKNLKLITEDGTNVFYKSGGKVKSFTDVAKILHDTIGKLNPQMQTMALKTIFGQYALAGMAAITNTTNKEMKDLTNNFGKTGTAAAVLDEKSKGFGAQMRRLSATFETFKKDIGDKLQAPMEKIIDVLTWLMKKFVSLPDSTQQMIVNIAAVASVVALLGGALLSIVGTMGMFINSFAEGMAVLAEFAPEIGLVVAAITALIAIGVALKNAWDRDFGHIQEKTAAVWNWVTQQFNAAMKTISQTVQTGIKTLEQWWQKIGPDAMQAMHNIYQAIIWLKPVWQGIWLALGFVVKLAWDTIVGTIKDAWGFVSGVFQLFVHLVNGQWTKAWQDFKQVIWNGLMLVLDFFDVRWVGTISKGVLKLLTNFGMFKTGVLKIINDLFKEGGKIFSDLVVYVTKLFGDLFKDVGAIFQHLMNTLANLWHSGASLLKGDVKGFWQDLKNAFNTGIQFVVSLVQGMMRTFDNLYGQLPSKAYRWATNKMLSFVRGLRDGIANVVRTVIDIIRSIQTRMEQLPGEAFKWGANMMKMLADGIEAFVGRIKNSVLNIANWIKDHLGHFSPAKEGPLSQDDRWMPNMINMFADGIEANRPNLQKALGKVVTDIQANLDPNSASSVAKQLQNIGQLMFVDPYANAYDRQSGHSQHKPTTYTNIKGVDPYANAYDRLPGHSQHHPVTSLYDRVASRAHNITINVNIEGRSKETDRHLVQQVADELGKRFRTHIPMHVG